ncbi:MAG: SurA N-terminal domain-containing protein [Bacteroidales bacterium]|nr:SurA N-terminal domain-containing protein [Bacteroidales bacterium]
MATLENIRKRGKLLAIVIGLALLAFVLGDMINSGKALFGGQKFDIVSVNQENINIQKYEQLIYETEAYYEIMQGGKIDGETSQQIRTSVWDMIIREALLANTYEDLGIDISTEELSDMIIGTHIHPMIYQTLVNPQTGQFDKQFVITLYQNFEQIKQEDEQQAEQLRQILKYTEDYIKKDTKYNKYIALVSKGLYVTSLEVKEDNFERTYTVDIDLVGKTINEVTDTTIKATEIELENYYNEHKEFYKNVTATRDISYITLDVVPSKTDSITAKDKAEKFKSELEASDGDEQSVVNLKSYNAQLVRYYTAGELNNPLLDSILFNSEVGSTYGPYLEYGTYNVAKVVDKIDSRPDTVSARHILISPQNPKIGSMAKAQTVADSIVDVLNNGGDFDLLAAKYSDDPGSKDKGGLYEDFTEGSMVPEFNDYCFSNPVGKIGTVETNFGIHIIEVTERKNLVSKTKLAFVQVEIVPSQTTYDLLYSEAMRIRGLATDEKSFDKVVEENGFLRKEATDITQGTYTIPGLSDVKEIVNWSFKAKQGEVSNVFEQGDKYIIAMLKTENKVGYLSLEKVKTQVENSVIQRKKVDKIYTENFEGQTVSDLDAFAGKINAQKLTIPKVAFNAFQLATIGYEPALLGAIKKFEVGKIYGPIKGVNGVYFVKANTVNVPVELTPEEITAQKQRMIDAMKQRANYQAYTALRDASKIIDRRSNFY